MQPGQRLLRGASRLLQGSDMWSDSPWDASRARELQEAAEGQLSHWRQRARKAEKEAESLKAALNQQQDVGGPIPMKRALRHVPGNKHSLLTWSYASLLTHLSSSCCSRTAQGQGI